MTIHIVDETPDIYMTRGEYERALAEYQRSMMFYAGPPITFEEWVRGRSSVTTTDGARIKLST